MKLTLVAKGRTMRPLLTMLLVSGSAAVLLWGQTIAPTNTQVKDPGVRSGAANAGAALPGLTADQMNHFTEGKGAFREVESVSGTLPGEGGSGLGPTFNLNSCAGCHA